MAFCSSFVGHVASISHEYVFMSRTPEELWQIMQLYEEEGLPGAVGSVDVVHVGRAGDYNCLLEAVLTLQSFLQLILRKRSELSLLVLQY